MCKESRAKADRVLEHQGSGSKGDQDNQLKVEMLLTESTAALLVRKSKPNPVQGGTFAACL